MLFYFFTILYSKKQFISPYSDLHEAAEWNKQQNRHHSGAFGAETQSHAANEHSNWNHDRHKAYNHEKSQSFAKGNH